MRTQNLNDADAALFFYIGSSLNLCDTEVWPIFTAAKSQGCNTWQQWADRNLEDFYVVPTDDELAQERELDDHKEEWEGIYVADNYSKDVNSIPLKTFLSLYGDTYVHFYGCRMGFSYYYSEFPKVGEPKNVIKIYCSPATVHLCDKKVSEVLVSGMRGWGEVIKADFVNPNTLIIKTPCEEVF